MDSFLGDKNLQRRKQSSGCPGLGMRAASNLKTGVAMNRRQKAPLWCWDCSVSSLGWRMKNNPYRWKHCIQLSTHTNQCQENGISEWDLWIVSMSTSKIIILQFCKILREIEAIVQGISLHYFLQLHEIYDCFNKKFN